LRHNPTLLQLFLPVLLMLALLCSAANAVAAPQIAFLPDTSQSLGKGMLWKVSSPSGRSSYLFGTIHVDDPEIINLAPPVRSALNSSKSLTLELIPDQSTQLQSALSMMFQDGRNLEKVAGRSLYKRAISAMKGRGIPEPMIGQMKPWAVMATLSVPKSESGKFLDIRLYDQAKKVGKQTHALESSAEQMAAFNNMPMKEQVKMLKETLDTLPKLKGYFRQIKQAWLQRDLEKLQSISDKQMPADDPASKKLMEGLLDKRNQTMHARMQPRLKEGRAFIAVGALHLPGKKGLIQLLRQSGYTVKAVW